jgi:ferric-dicitrate binding protein FerR (iron transport regulator)
MNDDNGHSAAGRAGPDDGLIATLIRNAGPRETPSAAHYAQVLAATRRSWRKTVAARRRRRFAWRTAAGVAAVALVMLAGQRFVGDGPGPVVVAATDALAGAVDVWRESRPGWAPLDHAGIAITDGTRIRTGATGRAGLILADGASLRIDAESEIAFEAPGRLRLETGALYVDTGAGSRTARRIEVHTPAGLVWDVGTQFEVRYRDEQLLLRIREGRTILERGDEDIQVLAGEQLRVTASDSLERSAVSPFGPEWKWVQAVAPLPYADTLTVQELLEWVARETGREIHFSEPGLAARAGRTILHGNQHRLLPMEALAVMLATTDLDYTVIGDDEILITGEAR